MSQKLSKKAISDLIKIKPPKGAKKSTTTPKKTIKKHITKQNEKRDKEKNLQHNLELLARTTIVCENEHRLRSKINTLLEKQEKGEVIIKKKKRRTRFYDYDSDSD